MKPTEAETTDQIIPLAMGIPQMNMIRISDFLSNELFRMIMFNSFDLRNSFSAHNGP